MLKSLGILIGGIFVGAMGAEIIRKECPDALDKLQSKAREVGAGVKEAFKKGYDSATRPKKSARPAY